MRRNACSLATPRAEASAAREPLPFALARAGSMRDFARQRHDRHGALILITASSIGRDETDTIPPNGLSRSSVIMTVIAIVTAHKNMAPTTIAFRGANSPQLKNRMPSQTW